MPTQERLYADARYILATDIGGFLVCAILFWGLSRIRYILSPLGLGIAIIAFAIAFAANFLLWLYRGIRSIDLDETTLTLCRGRGMDVIRIERADVESIRVRRGFGRTTVVLRFPRSAQARDDSADRSPVPPAMRSRGRARVPLMGVAASSPATSAGPSLRNRTPLRRSLRIRDDAFPREAFLRMARAFEGWRKNY